MKIVYLSTSQLPSRQANSIHVMKMCAAFANLGHEVTLVVSGLNSSSDDKQDIFNYYGVNANFKIKNVFWPRIRFGEYIYAFFMFWVVLRYNPDLVFSRFPLGSYFSSILKSHQILETHYPIEPKSKIQRPLFEWYSNKNNFVKLIVITKALKNIIVNQYPNLSNKIFVAPDGADMHPKVLEKKTVSNNQFNVGYVGHLYKGRGIELIINLAKRCSWAIFHIVGGNEGDIKRVRKLISDQNISNLEVHGFIPPDATNDFRLKMDVLLAPYQEKVHLAKGDMTTEGWMSPLKIFEYMSAGKAIISSDLPVLHEVLKSEFNCILCKPSDIDDWTSALIRLKNDNELKVRLGRNALEDLRRNYLWSVRAKNIVDLIHC